VPYIDTAGYAERFTQRELDQLTATAGASMDFTQAASDASETIDSYLAAIPGRTFAVPLTVPPARIVGVAADLTRYELWSARASEEVAKRRDQAMEYLRDLVAGRAQLLVEVATPEAPLDPSARVGYRTAGRTFTGATLAGFVEDNCDENRHGH
jgi:phage gp36-like protein